jgi:ADP-ribosylglycohydrolase
LLGEPDRHRFLFRRGMLSDDTEHTCMVMQAMIASVGRPDEFTAQLARRLRFWILGLPAGVGLATLRATLKLWVGVPPERSGVFSAGNGPAMRSAVIGAVVDDLDELRRLICASTRITHRDPKAEYGALAVALAANLAGRNLAVPGRAFLSKLDSLLGPDGAEFVALAGRAVESAESAESTCAFAKKMGLERGVSGYVYHTVPVALQAWLRHPHDYRMAVSEAVRCGGDTDTTAAIVGGIVGATVGKEGIPGEWLSGLWEWPRTITWLECLAGQLDAAVRSGNAQHPIRLPALGVVPRNFLFLGVVLGHGVRRALPPY